MMLVYEYEAARCLVVAERIDEQVQRGELSAAAAERDLIALETVIIAYKTYTRITPAEWRHAGRLAGWWPAWWTEGPVGAVSAGNGQRK
jgi:hypothetical protein